MLRHNHSSARRQDIMSLLQEQGAAIASLRDRVSVLESSSQEATDLQQTVQRVASSQEALQKAFLAQERIAMQHADVAEDVRAMKKEQDSHRYDIRLLKANVGELISADRAYSLEVEQARHRLERSMQASAVTTSSNFHVDQIIAGVVKTLERHIDGIVDARVHAYLSSSNRPNTKAKTRGTNMSQNVLAGTGHGRSLDSQISTGNKSNSITQIGNYPNHELHDEFLKSKLVAEGARSIANPRIDDATRSLESDLERLERNVMAANNSIQLY